MGIFMDNIDQLTEKTSRDRERSARRMLRLSQNIDELMERSERELRQMPLPALIAGCQKESFEGREQERGYGFELFRRALQEKNDAAWEAVEEQYFALVSVWCYETVSEELTAEEIDLFARGALVRFWQTLSTREETLDKQFSHIGAILKYLRHCAQTVVHDHNREQRRRERIKRRFYRASSGLDPRAFENIILDEIERSQLIQKVSHWMNVYAEDELERLVFRLSYEEGLTPRRIATLHEDRFKSVTEVHQVKERVMRRLRRAMQELD
jgi:hypothetical protein